MKHLKRQHSIRVTNQRTTQPNSNNRGIKIAHTCPPHTNTLLNSDDDSSTEHHHRAHRAATFDADVDRVVDDAAPKLCLSDE
jgi:hypothetical protein